MHVVYVLDRKDILLFDLNHLTDLLVESDYPVLQQRTTCKETNYCKKGPMIRNMGYNASAKKKKLLIKKDFIKSHFLCPSLWLLKDIFDTARISIICEGIHFKCPSFLLLKDIGIQP